MRGKLVLCALGAAALALAVLAPAANASAVQRQEMCQNPAGICPSLDNVRHAGRQTLVDIGLALNPEMQAAWTLACGQAPEACLLLANQLMAGCEAAGPARQVLSDRSATNWLGGSCLDPPSFWSKIVCGAVFFWELVTTGDPKSASAEARGCEHDLA